jgi:hypothetical protein
MEAPKLATMEGSPLPATNAGGRPAALDRRYAGSRVLARAQSTGLIGKGGPTEMARQFLGLLWEVLMVGLLLGVTVTPAPAEAARRTTKATVAFMRLHPDPGADLT